MKKSKYVVLIPYKYAIIIYNTLWNTSILIHQKDKDKWGLKYSLNKFDIIDARLLRVLKEKKMIIEDNVDEIQMIREQLAKTNNVSNIFELTVIPTLACNFSCWYCYENHDNKDRITKAEIDSIIKMLQRKTQNSPLITNLRIQFFGGEPLLCYNSVMVPLLRLANGYLSDVKITVGITTNGYFLTEEKIIFLKQYGLKTVQITIDGNKERHNNIRFSYQGEDSYARIIHNIKLCIKHGVYVVVRINISEDTNLDVERLLLDFKELRNNSEFINFSIHKVWQSSDNVYEIIEEIVKAIRDNGYNCSSYFTHPSSIWETCYADKPNHIVINPKGEIFKCTARNFCPNQIEGYLQEDGLIKWTPLHEKRKSITPIDSQECLACSIFPICIGGCSQRLLEKNNDIGCQMSEEEKVDYARKVLFDKIRETTIK